jgi:hypothetical protein
MKYKDGRKFVRKIGQARKSQSIYDNLGHPFDIEKKKVIFIGKNGEPYSLTIGKEYTIIKAGNVCCYKKGKKRDRWMFDHSLKEKSKTPNECMPRDVDTSQGEDDFIQIINDKGHKREYSHLMFRLVA